MRPQPGDFPEYYGNYIAKAADADVMSNLLNGEKETFSFLRTIPEAMGDHAYAPGKWTIKQLLIHLSDSERIFCYRALRFARGDQQQPLPYEEDDYAAACQAEKRSLKSVIEEFESVRKATISFYESCNGEALQRSGQMAGHRTTVNALGFAICGHSAHHLSVLKERYLKK